MQARKTYDRRCYDLAEHFMQDEPTENAKRRCEELAAHIQSAIEDWLSSNSE